MTCKNNQVVELMKHIKKNNQRISAIKSGMSARTACKYLKANKLPSEMKKSHHWRTRKDGFESEWEMIESFLHSNPSIQAKTLLEYLISLDSVRYNLSMLRTLQRRIKDWKATKGKEKEVIFRQVHKPGRQSQSDYTDMNKLLITIAGKPFKHRLFHFILAYSYWEAITICYSESFDSLLQGFESAVWQLGAVAHDHRTDNLSAATKQLKNQREFTVRWDQVMKHYSISPSRNNPGESHENGSVEKSHDLLKNAIDQALLLRGSRDFMDYATYEIFLQQLINQRNSARKTRLLEELPHLKSLPNDKWYSPKVLPVRVSPSSVVHIESVAYSVPSRLISYLLKAHIYPDFIELYYGRQQVVTMRKQDKTCIDYRHVIDSLVRKPGAFLHYQYREALFPTLTFKKAYEMLCQHSSANGHKRYLQLLLLAKLQGEQLVEKAIKQLMDEQKSPLPDIVKDKIVPQISIPSVHIQLPNLTEYDQLLMGNYYKN